MKITESICCRDREEWRAWLAAHHRAGKEIWLVFFKKHTEKPTVSYEEAVEEAVCFGWIDGILQRLDEERCARKFTPRSAKSKWSPSNVERARRMVRKGRMTEAGLEKFRDARIGVSPPARKDLRLPDALAAKFEANPRAFACFNGLPESQRRLYVGWILSAKKEATRLRRLTEAIGRLEKGERLGLK